MARVCTLHEKLDGMASFSANALTVLRERYLQRDEAGCVVEDPDSMLRRVAGAIAQVGRH